MSEFVVNIENWGFQVDQDRMGEKEGWFAPTFDASAWMAVKSGAPWDFYDDALRGYEGVGWYRIELDGDLLGTDSVHRLKFDGVGGKAKIWCNGELVGQNRIRYLPFEVALPKPLLTAAANVIVVRVDNRAHPQSLPGAARIEWVLYGGLCHGVSLVSSTEVRFDWLHLFGTPGDAGGVVDFEFRVVNDSDSRFEASTALSIDAPDRPRIVVPVTCAPGSAVTCSGRLEVGDIDSWNLDSPRLYTATLALDVRIPGGPAEMVERFGFRSIAVEANQIILNGNTIFLKGFSRYDEYAPFGSSPDADVIRRDLIALKNTGANLVRVHYPQSRVHLDIADEIGLLYMQEVPLCWWRPDPTDELSYHGNLMDEAHEVLERVHARDANHPSWIIWSMGNENDSWCDAVKEGMHELMAHAKSLDRSRLLTWVDRHVPEADEYGEADIISLNLYFGIHHGSVAYRYDEFESAIGVPTRAALDVVMERYPDRPILMAEFGTGGIQGIRGETRYSLDYQAAFNRFTWDTLVSNANVQGCILWCWADYFHRSSFIGDGGFFNTPFGPFGVVTVDRQIKWAPYDAIVEMFRERP